MALGHLSFDDFLRRFGRNYSSQAGLTLDLGRLFEEYLERRELFETRRAAVLLQNERASRRWTATINKFADFFANELQAMHGYKPRARANGLSFAAQEEDHRGLKEALPEQVDWRHLADAKEIVDQQSCGSCWAISATTVLNAHSEIHRRQQLRFSTQEMLNCVPNPHECGGSGGCQGATVELGIAWATEPLGWEQYERKREV